MYKKKSIFDSYSETLIYKNLKLKWNGDIEIYNHLPVANLINILEIKELSQKEKDYLFKTSFDFVVASNKGDNFGEPLLIIEFDGIGQGYSKDDTYTSTIDVSHYPYRKLKMDTKLKACKICNLPIVVISDSESFTYDINNPDISVLDSIIGNVLAYHSFVSEFKKFDIQFENTIKDLTDKEDIQEIINSYGAGLEIESKMKYNPIYAEAVKIEWLLRQENIIKSPYGYRHSHSTENNISYCEFFYTLHDNTKVSYIAGVRTINCIGTSSGTLAEDLAYLLLMRSLAKRFDIIVE